MKQYGFLLLISISAICASCKHDFPKRSLPFGTVKGAHFTEVRRAFINGLKFDKQGYQLEPSWDLRFISDDSVMVLSPKMKRYYGFHVYFDHDSIFNMVDTWFKVKKITMDSLLLQTLRVENKVILDDDEGSKVFLTFYSDRYIKNHPTVNIQKMGMPDIKDTLFIRSRAKLANSNKDSSFAARQPVILKSKNPLVEVEKVKNVSTPLKKIDASDDYLSAEYNVTIHKAYEAFGYSFYVFVDDKGKMYFRNSTVFLMPEFKATYEQVMKGIVNGYLQHYLEITPGHTLGISHTSYVLLNVTGKRE
ncbi:MAG: hypothetical protein JWR54_741 [Mucilaginibacter sp.]|jgi:hypothetical protein|nr:hypothetical protein [Mucilaginibacter sp.]